MSAHTSSWNVHATHTKFSHVNDLIFAYFLAFKLLTLSVFTAKSIPKAHSESLLDYL